MRAAFVALALFALTGAASAAPAGDAASSPAAKSEAATKAPLDGPINAPLNGFDVANASVPDGSIRGGGPPRDGIRSVDTPGFVAPDEATWVGEGTPVIGVAVGDTARAYPVHLLEYHQIVNDRFGETPVVVTYDPLAGSPLVFEASVEDHALTFGVSGLVHESNFLLYDRETKSLWSQLRGEAIAGPMVGKKLRRIRCRQEAFGVWQHRHRTTTVLERPAPRHIDYRHSPFSKYWASETVPYPVSAKDERFHPKEAVLGVEVGGQARAYIASVVVAAGGRIVDEIDGREVRIAYDLDAGAFSWEIDDGVVVTEAYWFAWKAFRPQTQVWLETGVEGLPAEPGA